MAFNIPATQTIVNTNLTNLESKINQTSPLNDKSFLQVLAVLLGLNQTQLYKLGVDRALQNLALTATFEDLDFVGINYGVVRKAAESTVLTVETSGSPAATISATNSYVGDANAARYFLATTATIPGGGTVSFDVTSQEQGVSGNLNVGDGLSIAREEPGVASTAAVTVVVTLGADRESDDDYRFRVLDEIRTVGGGSNSADYRRWSQEVANVERAYPYTGKPFGSIEDSLPGERTVYVQADETIEPDGIAPTILLDAVRTSITTDPVTGEDRQCLGSTDDTLYVESISRTGFQFTIRGLTVTTGIIDSAKADLEIELSNYATGLRPFVEGLDSDVDKNDTVTPVSASEVVSDVLKKYAGYAESVGVSRDPFVSFLASYSLNPGELAKSSGVIYE